MTLGTLPPRPVQLGTIDPQYLPLVQTAAAVGAGALGYLILKQMKHPIFGAISGAIIGVALTTPPPNS